jgi:ABC-2 type transport system permease protein
MKLNLHFIGVLAWRDLRRYFSSPTGYVFITLFIFLSAAAAFWQDRFFLDNLANLSQLNAVFPLLLVFFVPALTMSVWSEERRLATDELLLTLPASSLEVVLGKFLATLGIYVASLVLSLSHVLVLVWLGSPDPGVTASNYLGYLLSGAALISIGLLASLVTSNPAVAFILGAVLCALVAFPDTLAGAFSRELGQALSVWSLEHHFREFARGIITLGGVTYFGAVLHFFLHLNVLMVDRRHWPLRLEGRPVWFHRGLRLAAAAVVIVSVVAIAGRIPLRLDATAEGLHSLSEGTLSILRELEAERPVFIQAFISPVVPGPLVQTRENLLNTLLEIDAAAGPAVEVLIEDTLPFSPQARDAREKFGIVPREVPSLEGAQAGLEEVFMGLALTCGAAEQVIPFLDRGLSPEYELARSIRVVASAERKRIGVLQTGLNLFGGLDFQTMRSSPTWSVVEELRKQYNVLQLQPMAELPEGLDGLLVMMPSSLGQPEMDWLRDVIRSGLPTLLLDDPLPTVNINLAASEDPSAGQNPFTRSQMPQRPKGDVVGLLADLGLSWDPTKVVWDTHNPHPDLAYLPPEVVFVAAGNQNPETFHRHHPAATDLQELVLLYPGSVEPGSVPGLEFVPLVQSGGSSGRLSYRQLVQRTFFGVQLNRDLPHEPDESVYTLAAEVRGTPLAKSAESASGERGTAGTGDSGTAPAAEPVASETKSDASRPIHLIFIPDVDFISEQFFQIRARGPENLRFDNVSFFLNCMDSLVGDHTFIALRNKRVRHRTLERVEAQTRTFLEQRVAEEKQAEQEAQAALKEAQKRLDERVDEVRGRPDLDLRTKQIMVRNLEEAENRKLEVLKANIEAEKEAKIHASRERTEEQIRRIQNTIRTFAVLLPPIPVFALGVWIFVRRQRRERESAAASRRLRG